MNTNLKKVAKLVTISVTSRLIVEADATDEKIVQLAIPCCSRNLLEDGILDHVESIEDDVELPFGAIPSDMGSS